MAEGICSTINALAYGGLLRPIRRARQRGIRLAEARPSRGAEIVIIDISGMGALCSTDAATDSYSRFSFLSAAISLAVADQIHRDGVNDIGLISPYRSQVQFLAAASQSQSHLTAATIHRFQGSERDTVVFDLVDSYGPGGVRASSPARTEICRFVY